MTAVRRVEPNHGEHQCPGKCGRLVPNQLYACRACWFRLPRDLRRPITGNYGVDALEHMRAMSDANQWYAENPS